MSLIAELHNARKARHQRIAMAAERHEWNKSAKTDNALVAELKAVDEPPAEPAPEPDPVAEWVERQKQKHKPVWFSVISAVKVTPRGAPTIRNIQRVTCDVYGVKMHDLLSARRTADIVMPRQVSMYLAKELTALSLPRIARATGDRDHSTAHHAHRKIEHLLKSDDNLARKIALIRGQLA